MRLLSQAFQTPQLVPPVLSHDSPVQMMTALWSVCFRWSILGLAGAATDSLYDLLCRGQECGDQLILHGYDAE